MTLIYQLQKCIQRLQLHVNVSKVIISLMLTVPNISNLPKPVSISCNKAQTPGLIGSTSKGNSNTFFPWFFLVNILGRIVCLSNATK